MFIPSEVGRFKNQGLLRPKSYQKHVFTSVLSARCCVTEEACHCRVPWVFASTARAPSCWRCAAACHPSSTSCTPVCPASSLTTRATSTPAPWKAAASLGTKIRSVKITETWFHKGFQHLHVIGRYKILAEKPKEAEFEGIYIQFYSLSCFQTLLHLQYRDRYCIRCNIRPSKASISCTCAAIKHYVLPIK